MQPLSSLTRHKSAAEQTENGLIGCSALRRGWRRIQAGDDGWQKMAKIDYNGTLKNDRGKVSRL